MTKKYFRLIFLLISMVLCDCRVLSQNIPPYKDVSIASPTAASLGKYADIPVSYHTGIPQIDLPIYTIKAGSLELPVSLSYHASGLKVQEMASWVGAGWALNAGGVITRSVMGAPDEKGTATQNQSWGHYSDYGYNSYFYENSGGHEDWDRIAKGEKDGEPDLFFFNFAGYSGKFYFSDDRTPVLVPQQDIKIEANYPQTGTGNISIQSFTLTTPDGTKYLFGNSPGKTATEITKPYTSENGLPSGNTISSWYLNKISSFDDMFHIDLSYTPENYGYYTFSTPALDGDASPVGSPLQPGVYDYQLIKNVVQGVRLSSISFPNGSLNFIPGDPRTDLSDNSATFYESVNYEAKTLGTIQILNGSSPMKNFNFTYGYFPADNSALTADGIADFNIHTDETRLRLDNIQETSGDGTITVPPYQFSYFSDINPPRRLSFGIDHWGFYNGVAANHTLIPSYQLSQDNIITEVPGAVRDASWPQMLAGSLQKIIYPTGGTTTFDFEANSFFNTTSSTNRELIPFNTLACNWYGQTDANKISAYLDFTTTGTDNVVINVTNYSTAWSAEIVIRNSNNNIVFSSNLIQQATINPPNYNPPITPYNSVMTIALPEGTYQANLFYPSATQESDLHGGVFANISQYQTITTNTVNNITVGGLRIAKITRSDGILPQNDIVTNYSYTDASGMSTGFLFSHPTYVQQVRNDMIKNIGYWHPDGNGGYFDKNNLNPNGCPGNGGWYFKSGGSLRPMATTQGNNIGYKQVTVSQTGNGYSIYNYFLSNGSINTDYNTEVAKLLVNSDLNNCDLNTPNYPAAPLPFDSKRGELAYEQHFDKDGAHIKDIFYYPHYDDQSVSKTPAFIVTQRGMAGTQILLGTQYYLSSPKKKDITSYEYDYGNGNTLTTITTTNYESNFHNQPTTKIIKSSKEEDLTAHFKYVFDYRVPDCDAISDCSASYTTDCNTCQANYNSTLASIIAPQTTCSQDPGCVTQAYLTKLECLSNARATWVGCRRSHFTDDMNTFKITHDAIKNNQANSDLKPILELQDDFNNALIETTSWRGSNLIDASFTKYDYALSPANKVYPNIIQKINLSVPSSSYTPSANTNVALTKDSRYSNETTIQFYNGNLVEVLPKSGVSTSYVWDYENNLPVVKATGIDNVTLRTAYINVNNDLSLLRSQPSLAKAQLSTYTYSPLKGITSETNVQGIKVAYEYDALGRLLLIRDKDNYILKKINYAYSSNISLANLGIEYNSTGLIFSIQLTNVSTNSVYNFTVPYNVTVSALGHVPSGIYNVQITATGGPNYNVPGDTFIQFAGFYNWAPDSNLSLTNITLTGTVPMAFSR